MPAFLSISRRPAPTVFHLLGELERDLTFALGYGLARADAFRHAFLTEVAPDLPPGEQVSVDLERHEAGAGRTDIEIRTSTQTVVIEAKRGYTLPNWDQLKGYTERIRHDPSPLLVSISDLSRDYVLRRANDVEVPLEVPFTHVPWREAADLAERSCAATRTLDQKRLLRDLTTYLRSIVGMQKTNDNIVFVVALNNEGTPSSIELLKKYQVYCHPQGGRWPAEPPNYMGFRWNHQLQSIHHVDSHEFVEDLHEMIPEIPAGTKKEPLVGYRLGPAIRPDHTVHSGPIRDRHVRAAIDLLLTSNTVAEAALATRKRGSA